MTDDPVPAAGFPLPGDRLPTIAAGPVRLRCLGDDDVDALFGIFGDPEVMRYWSSPTLASRDDAAQLLAQIRDLFARHELYQWGVARHEDDRLVGTCTLAGLDAGNRRAEIGFALGRDAWGHGYMTHAATALLDYAFTELRLHRIEADVDPDNAASVRLLERLGFVREGRLRERWLVHGRPQDSLLMGLLATDPRRQVDG